MLKRLFEFLRLGSGSNVFESGNPQRLTASGQVSGQPSSLMGIFVASASNTPTLQVLNSLAAGGAVLVNTFTPIAGTFYPLPFQASIGLFVVISGTVDCTVAFSPNL